MPDRRTVGASQTREKEANPTPSPACPKCRGLCFRLDWHPAGPGGVLARLSCFLCGWDDHCWRPNGWRPGDSRIEDGSAAQASGLPAQGPRAPGCGRGKEVI
jgi:hypothetical protein